MPVPSKSPWTTTRTGIILGVVLAASAVIYNMSSGPVEPVRTGDFPLIPIHDWDRRGELQIRKDTRSSNDLLLGQIVNFSQPVKAIYRYDPKSGFITRTADSAWQASAAPISSSIQSGDIIGPPYLVRKENSLIYDGRSISGRGSTMRGYSVSPSTSNIAIISVDGGRRPHFSIFPFMGGHGGGFAGQHYVEFFQFPSLERIGEPVKVLVEDFGLPCWSADESYLVIPHTDFEHVCFVPVPSIHSERELEPFSGKDIPRENKSGPGVSILPLSDWDTSGELLVRRDSNSIDDLLLNQEPDFLHRHSFVFRFSTKTNAVTKIPTFAWDLSAAPVSSPKQLGLITGPSIPFKEGNKLLAENHVLVARGSVIRDYYVSPSKSLIAIISVDGKPKGIQTSHGNQHYVEFLQWPSCQKLGEPIELPFHDFGLPCWTADESFFLIPYTNFKFLCVVVVPVSQS